MNKIQNKERLGLAQNIPNLYVTVHQATEVKGVADPKKLFSGFQAVQITSSPESVIAGSFTRPI